MVSDGKCVSGLSLVSEATIDMLGGVAVEGTRDDGTRHDDECSPVEPTEHRW